jgi:hypothetical protein
LSHWVTTSGTPSYPSPALGGMVVSRNPAPGLLGR